MTIKRELVIAVILFLASIAIVLILIKTKPQATKEVIKTQDPLVETVSVINKPLPLIIRAQGQVESAYKLRLQAEVSGKVIYKNSALTKGGLLKKGELLLSIDPTDYELALRLKKAALSRAELELALESAKQQVAEDEFSRRETDEIDAKAADLAKRLPYLAKAQSEYQAALADFNQAHHNLDKTNIRSPINAMVAQSYIELNEMLALPNPIAELVGIDEFFAEISIPVAELSYIVTANNHQHGSAVKLRQISKTGTSIERQGEVKNILPSLGKLGHMAQLIVSIPQPITITEDGFAELPLLPGALVSAEITGLPLNHSLAIPRAAIHEGDVVYVLSSDHHLVKKSLNIIRREKDFVYISAGVDSSDLLVSTKLSSIKNGLAVRLANNNEK